MGIMYESCTNLYTNVLVLLHLECGLITQDIFHLLLDLVRLSFFHICVLKKNNLHIEAL